MLCWQAAFRNCETVLPSTISRTKDEVLPAFPRDSVYLYLYLQCKPWCALGHKLERKLGVHSERTVLPFSLGHSLGYWKPKPMYGFSANRIHSPNPRSQMEPQRKTSGRSLVKPREEDKAEASAADCQRHLSIKQTCSKTIHALGSLEGGNDFSESGHSNWNQSINMQNKYSWSNVYLSRERRCSPFLCGNNKRLLYSNGTVCKYRSFLKPASSNHLLHSVLSKRRSSERPFEPNHPAAHVVNVREESSG